MIQNDTDAVSLKNLEARMREVDNSDEPAKETLFISEIIAKSRAPHDDKSVLPSASEQKRNAPAALSVGNDRYRALLEALDDGFCIIEFIDGPHGPLSDYVHVEANSGYERHTGISGIVGKRLREIVGAEAEGWLAIYSSVLRTGEPVRFEREFIAAGRPIEVSAVRLGSAEARQVAVLFRDIGSRVRAEEALRVSEAIAVENMQRVQLALSAGAIIGTWFWDLPTDRFRVDEAFARTFGLDPALGRDGLSLEQVISTVHPDDKAGVVRAIDEAITRGGAYAHQYRVRRSDGWYYWIEANGKVELGPDGNGLNFPGVLLNIQERREVEAERDRALIELRAFNETLEDRVAERTAQLLETEEQLRQSQKMEAVGQLTGGVAHDFNNFLTVIRGSVDLLRRPDIPESRRNRYIEAIADTADRAAKLTSQLLSFARRQTLKPVKFSVGANLGAIRDMMATLAGPMIDIVIEPPLESCFTEADANQFDTAIFNIVANARDAMAGAGQLTVRVTGTDGIPAVRSHPARHGHFVCISLSDTGCGISPRQLERVFEPFYTTKPVGHGTGLGLSHVFGFVKQSGGDILVDSIVGEGTTFRLFLPRCAAPLEQDVTDVEKQHGLNTSPSGRILVVEDNEDVGRFVTAALTELGYAPTYVRGSDQALEVLESEGGAFNMLLSDVLMPGMSGIELAHIVRKRFPEIPILLASGYSEVLAADGLQSYAFIQKPYSLDKLTEILSENIKKIAI
ncbi:ATP-binding protein [Sphingomonas abietis]|uniref:histidine kinase n=1 Tax=Sphingomonas abietis TaxID=3012344 RepID=A0ABY7NUZ7_9SPHN|nr:ATP-binding protein [Sphingomonas abietis]WBO24382.1 ATP-binding protein [Sphingomonas abietis]